MKAGLVEKPFDVFGVIIIKTIGRDVFVVGDFVVERIDVAASGDETSHFGESAFVGYFDNGDAAGLEDAIEFGEGFVHVLEMVSDANHHKAV